VSFSSPQPPAAPPRHARPRRQRRAPQGSSLPPSVPGRTRWPRLAASSSAWIAIALGIHVAVLTGWLGYLARNPGTAAERAPVPVTILHDAPEEPEPNREMLHFRKPTHPHVRQQLPVPRLVQALAPPPPEAVLEAAGAPGGFALEPVSHSSLGGFAAGGSGGGVAFRGVGRGNGDTPGGSFAEYVGGLQQIGLDVVFVVDATGSMGWLIEEVKNRVASLAEWIRELVPVTRFGVVAYRDTDAPDFLVRVEPLTLRVSKIHGFLEDLEAKGGGDIPEAVHAGLAAAISQAGWKEDSRKVILILADAPPHPERSEEALALARSFRAQGGTVSVIDVSFDANPEIAALRLGKPVAELQTLQRRGVMPELGAIAEAGGGDAATLQGDTRVVRQLAVLIFGKSWAAAVQPLVGDL